MISAFSSAEGLVIQYRRVAVKRERTRARNIHVEQLAAMAFRTFENDNLIRARAALEASRVFAARSLNENLDAPPHIPPILFPPDLIDPLEEPAVPLGDNFLRHRVRQGGRGRPFPR